MALRSEDLLPDEIKIQRAQAVRKILIAADADNALVDNAGKPIDPKGISIPGVADIISSYLYFLPTHTS
jgi:hypothetical protein